MSPAHRTAWSRRMRTTVRLLRHLAVLAALSGALTACGSPDSDAPVLTDITSHAAPREAEQTDEPDEPTDPGEPSEGSTEDPDPDGTLGLPALEMVIDDDCSDAEQLAENLAGFFGEWLNADPWVEDPTFSPTVTPAFTRLAEYCGSDFAYEVLSSMNLVGPTNQALSSIIDQNS